MVGVFKTTTHVDSTVGKQNFLHTNLKSDNLKSNGINNYVHVNQPDVTRR